MANIIPIGSYSGEFTRIQSGDVIAPASLGTGTASSTTVLFGNSTFSTVVTSVGGTGTVSGLTLSGSVTTTGSLTLGGTLAVTASNFASQSANTLLIAPNGSAGVPTFRTLVAADVPTLNQNTTGSAGSAAIWTTGRTITLTGDTTGTSASFNGSANLSFATTISDTIVTAKVLTGYVAGSNTAIASTDSILVAFQKTQGQINSISGANGTVTSVGGTGTVSGLTLTGTVTTSGNLTLGGTLAVTASNFASQTANTFLSAPNGSAGVPTFRTIVAADVPTLNQNTTGSAGAVPWSGITSKPTTVSGFGITDAYTETEVDTLLSEPRLSASNLVLNGFGTSLSNKYFSNSTFNSGAADTGAGSFSSTANAYSSCVGTQFISIDPTRRYKLSVAIRQRGSSTTSTAYTFLQPYDVDKLSMYPETYLARPDTLTTLAVALVNGATTVTLTSSTNWYNTADANTHHRGFIFWNYTDGTGKTWGPGTYSRNVFLNQYAGGGISGNVITLSVPWAGGTVASGTQLSNSSSAGSYLYNGWSGNIPTTVWTTRSGIYSGLIAPYSLNNGQGIFPSAAKYVQVGWLANYAPDSANSSMEVSAISLTDISVANETTYVGTTAISLSRASASQTLTGVSIDGTASAWTTGRTFALTGDVTGTSAAMTGAGNLSWSTAIADATVTGKVLTGYTAGSNTALASTDTILAAMGKIQGQINAVSSANGTVTSVGGTGTVSGLTLTGTVTTTGNLTLGGTLAVTASNFASQTANYALIAPSGSAGVPTFRQLELSDIPDAWTKKSVKAATTANITLSGTQTVDGIALVATDRCLVKNQSTASQNGIYSVAAGAWTRVLGGNTASEIAGAAVNVDSGTQGGTLFTTTFKTTDTLDTTAMNWYQVVDTSLAGTVVGSTLGTAAIGTSIFYARQDHVHPLQTTVTGNAGSATNIAGGTANQIPYQTGAGATAFYSGANYGVQTYTATGVPSAVAGVAGVLQGSASAIPAFTTTPTLTGTNFTGIPNGALTNSSLTIGSTSVALGSTTTTFAGLVSVTSTTFVGALTGSATQLGGVAAASYALKADTLFIGTTSIALNRTTAAQSLTGITSIDGTASAWTTGRTFALSGDVTGTSAAMTGSGNLSWATAIADATVTGKVLTGYTSGANTALAATDTILAAMGKIQGQINAVSSANGTVTSVSVTTANGVSGSVATATSTPAITITLGAITPSSVASTGTLSGTTLTVGSGTTTSDVIIAGVMNRDRAGALTTAATTLVDLDTWAAASYRSAKYVIQAVDTVSGNVYFTEVMVTKNNANDVYITEYASIGNGTTIIALSADYDGTTNVRLRVTPASTNSTQIKFRATIFNI